MRGPAFLPAQSESHICSRRMTLAEPASQRSGRRFRIEMLRRPPAPGRFDNYFESQCILLSVAERTFWQKARKHTLSPHRSGGAVSVNRSGRAPQQSEIRFLRRNMRTTQLRMLSIVMVVLVTGRMWGQSTDQPAYLNPALSAQDRATDLVHRMTLEEKASQLVNGARAIPKLHVDAYNWWSEALHEIGRASWRGT